jgi:hypothetical protein
VERGLEVGRGLLRGQPERIEVGGEVPARAVRRHQLEHGGLALGVDVDRARRRRGQRAGAPVQAPEALELRDDGRVRPVAGLAALERVEPAPPFGDTESGSPR